MMAHTDAIIQNLPEMLVQDLTERQDVFLARNLTAGRPLVAQAPRALAPDVPQRSRCRVARHMSYSASSEADLYSVRRNSMGSAWRGEEGGHVLKDAQARRRSFQIKRSEYMMLGACDISIKPGGERGERKLTFNGMDEGWGSDSSADLEPGMTSPSVRTRQQSFTTAATSVDVVIGPGGGRGVGGSGSVAGSPQETAAHCGGVQGESWVDLEPDMLQQERNVNGGRGKSVRTPDDFQHQCGSTSETHSAKNKSPASRGDRSGQVLQPPIQVPRRSSSLSHRAGTVTLGENIHSRRASTHNSSNLGQASQQHMPSPPPPPPPLQTPSHLAPLHPSPPSYWEGREAALGNLIPTARRSSLCNLQVEPLRIASDQLSLPPLITTDIAHHDATLNHRHQQPPKHRKSLSATTMPVLGRVNTWLSSGGGGSGSTAATTAAIEPLPSDLFPSSSSPNGMSPIFTNIRVSGDVLENLRLIVCNFPDLPLLTSCLTIQTIRSYARKLRRGDLTHERVPARLHEGQSPATVLSPTSPELPRLSRKTSLGNLKLMSSLRGKLTNRFGHSASSAALHRNEDRLWAPPVGDAHIVTFGLDNLPSVSVETEVEACVNALRVIFPDGTNYLLDLLYAHVIAYNYIHSLIGGLAPLKQGSGFPPLHSKSSMKLPAGVTSLADLQMHPDSSETVIHDFHQNVATAASRVVVPSKAAATLGLGSTELSRHIAPAPGSRGGFNSKTPLRTSPTAASFAQSLESEQAMRNLRDDITLNIYRLVEMIKSCSPGHVYRSHEEQNAILSITDGKTLDPMFMRAVCEVVRCYEELLG